MVKIREKMHMVENQLAESHGKPRHVDILVQWLILVLLC